MKKKLTPMEVYKETYFPYAVIVPIDRKQANTLDVKPELIIPLEDRNRTLMFVEARSPKEAVKLVLKRYKEQFKLDLLPLNVEARRLNHLEEFFATDPTYYIP